jgi:hypothetical protein
MACTTGGHAVFIQIIQGKCTRPDELREMASTWRRELGGGAEGWLGGTYGFTDDDQFIGVVRFESREAAMANSARPEQTAWAEKMMALMDGPVEFHDCDDVMLFLDGGSDEAGFVQVIRGRVDDPARIKAMLADTTALHVHRDDRVPRRGQRARRRAGGAASGDPRGAQLDDGRCHVLRPALALVRVTLTVPPSGP